MTAYTYLLLILFQLKIMHAPAVIATFLPTANVIMFYLACSLKPLKIIIKVVFQGVFVAKLQDAPDSNDDLKEVTSLHLMI